MEKPICHNIAAGHAAKITRSMEVRAQLEGGRNKVKWHLPNSKNLWSQHDQPPEISFQDEFTSTQHVYMHRPSDRVTALPRCVQLLEEKTLISVMTPLTKMTKNNTDQHFSHRINRRSITSI
jgi:hypothetical protein